MVFLQNKIYKLIKKMNRHYTLLHVSRQKSMETLNIEVYYDDTDRDRVYLLMEWANTCAENLKRRFHSSFDGKIIIVLHTREEALKQLSGQPKAEGILGLYKGGIIHLYYPKDMDKDDLKPYDVIFHEMVHAILDDLTVGNCPPWFSEGYALLLEKHAEETSIQRTPLSKTPMAYKMMTEKFYQLPHEESYMRALLLVETIEKTVGEQKLFQMINNMATAQKLD